LKADALRAKASALREQIVAVAMTSEIVLNAIVAALSAGAVAEATDTAKSAIVAPIPSR
jgi:hypothetical protein